MIDDAANIILPDLKHRPRIIPVLLLKGDLLYKTVKFGKPKYVGDPRIAVKIFNDKGADELVLLDITATPEKREPNFDLIGEIASEAFMPVGYGGGISSLEHARKILRLGIEKIIVNTQGHQNPELVKQISDAFGASSTVCSIDARRGLFSKYSVYTNCGQKKQAISPVEAAKRLTLAGAGEILINSIDRDGTFKGFDIDLVRQVADAVDVPVVACGGAGKLEDFGAVVKEGGASAAGAGSFFIFQLPHRAVLITFPTEEKLAAIFD